MPDTLQPGTYAVLNEKGRKLAELQAQADAIAAEIAELEKVEVAVEDVKVDP